MDLIEKKNDLHLKREKKDVLRGKLDTVISSIDKLKSDLDNVTTMLMLYYHKILNEGTDIRTEGIIWVIKAIWNLGLPIIPGYLPNFIDEQTVVYLFNVIIC